MGVLTIETPLDMAGLRPTGVEVLPDHVEPSRSPADWATKFNKVGVNLVVMTNGGGFPDDALPPLTGCSMIRNVSIVQQYYGSGIDPSKMAASFRREICRQYSGGSRGVVAELFADDVDGMLEGYFSVYRPQPRSEVVLSFLGMRTCGIPPTINNGTTLFKLYDDERHHFYDRRDVDSHLPHGDVTLAKHAIGYPLRANRAAIFKSCPYQEISTGIHASNGIFFGLFGT